MRKLGLPVKMPKVGVASSNPGLKEASCTKKEGRGMEKLAE
jgi:hypothetical protein